MSSAGGGDGRSSESYFTDFRKGEVNELLEQLRAASMDKPGTARFAGSLMQHPYPPKGGLRQVDIVKKVVAYMTLGIDVSRLFPQMVMVRLSGCSPLLEFHTLRLFSSYRPCGRQPTRVILCKRSSCICTFVPTPRRTQSCRCLL